MCVLTNSAVNAKTAMTEAGDAPNRGRSATVVALDTEPGARSDGGKPDNEKMEESYQPKGIEVGQFLLLPKLEIIESFNDNIYSRQDQKKADFIHNPELSAVLRSRFDRHMLNFKVQGSQFYYYEYAGENRLDINSEADGRVDVGEGGEITGLIQYALGHGDRSSPDDSDVKRPLRNDTYRLKMGGKQKVGDFTFGGEAWARRMLFSDGDTAAGLPLVNRDRDRFEYEGRLRGQYEIIPGYAAVSELGANLRSYDDTADNKGYRRSSTGDEALVGAAVDISSLMKGDVMVGYMRQNYEDSRMKDPSSPTVRVSLNWTPTPLTILVPSFERSVSENTSEGVSSIVRTSANIMIRHEYSPNILLAGYLGASYDDYQGNDQATWMYDAWVRTTYAFSQNMFVGGQLGYKVKHVDNTSGLFDQLMATIRLGLQI